MVYDEFHRLTEWENPELDTTIFRYDNCGHLRQIITPGIGDLTEVTQFDYPDVGTRVMTDAAGNQTTFVLDTADNINTVIQQPIGGPTVITTYMWDNLQQLLSYQDGNGNITRFGYILTGDFSFRLSGIQSPTGTLLFGWETGVIPRSSERSPMRMATSRRSRGRAATNESALRMRPARPGTTDMMATASLRSSPIHWATSPRGCTTPIAAWR